MNIEWSGHHKRNSHIKTELKKIENMMKRDQGTNKHLYGEMGY